MAARGGGERTIPGAYSGHVRKCFQTDPASGAASNYWLALGRPELWGSNCPWRDRYGRHRPSLRCAMIQYVIGKGHSVNVLWRGGKVDTIFGFEKEGDALEWIKEKSQAWLLQNR
jgi:hypothetical protein